MYRETLPDSVWNLMITLDKLPVMGSYCLAGGSALALQLGHRVSADLDLFSAQELKADYLKSFLEKTGLQVLILNETPAHIEMFIQSVKVDFIRGRIPLKFPPIPFEQPIKNLRMADLRDIGRMKLMAIASRGGRKDFVDLYCLTRKEISLESLIQMAMEEAKGVRYSRVLFLKGLIDFEEADSEEELNMLWDVSWEEVKQLLTEEVKRIAEKI